MTRDEETRLWIKTHLRQIERPEVEVAFDSGYHQALIDIEKEFDRITAEGFQFPVLHIRKWIKQQREEVEVEE